MIWSFSIECAFNIKKQSRLFLEWLKTSNTYCSQQQDHDHWIVGLADVFLTSLHWADSLKMCQDASRMLDCLLHSYSSRSQRTLIQTLRSVSWLRPSHNAREHGCYHKPGCGGFACKVCDEFWPVVWMFSILGFAASSLPVILYLSLIHISEPTRR